MKICIDGFSLNYLIGTGYYSYLYGLCSNLFRLYPQYEFHLLVSDNLRIPQWNSFKNMNYINISLDRVHNNFTSLENYLAQNHIDVYFSPNNGFSLPQNKKCNYIMAVHDLAPLSLSQLTDQKYSDKFDSLFETAITNADAILAVSEFVKSEILNYFDVPKNKIHVIYPCCLDIFSPMDKIVARTFLANKYKLEGDFILYAGAIHKRKNLDVLIRAFHSISQEYQSVNLVIAGDFNHKRLEYYLQLEKLIMELGLKKRVIFIGVVNYFDMPYFYNCARCTVNLSDYEGFPLSSLEAASCSCPVICLNNSSFREINIPTAIFLENLSIGHLKSNLSNILSLEPETYFLNKLNQPINYNWKKEIKKFIQILNTFKSKNL